MMKQHTDSCVLKQTPFPLLLAYLVLGIPIYYERYTVKQGARRVLAESHIFFHPLWMLLVT